MSKPLVTIIVPGRNVAAFAEEALESLRAQTAEQWRAVLVNDASTDATGAIFDSAARDDDRFRVIHHAEQRGLSDARNSALALVDTAYLGFLDADDVLVPTALERMLGVLQNTGSDFAVGAYVRLRPQPDGQYVAGEVQPWVRAATGVERRQTTLAEHPAASGNIVAWSKISRTDFWRRAGLRFPSGVAYEDQIVAQQMYTRARTFDTVPDVLVLWRERADGSSITQRKDRVAVLRDYLGALSGGIAVLDAADQHAAVAERVRLILAMDLPPLLEIARQHPDDEYRRLLGAFARDLEARGPSFTADASISAVLLW